MRKKLSLSKNRIRKSSRGIYLVLLALMLAFIMLFVGLVVTTGFLSVGAARFWHVSNLVALSALESFQQTQRTTDNPPLPADYNYKANTALTRANQIFSLNPLPGFASTFGSITHAPVPASPGTDYGGTLTFGNWHRERMGGTNPCEPDEPPCFKANPNVPALPDTSANAVMVELTNRTDNPFELPFCRLFNSCSKGLKARSYATMVQRCTAFVIDLSASTYFSTHESNLANNAAVTWTQPPNLIDQCDGMPTPNDDIEFCAVNPADHSQKADMALPFYLRSGLLINTSPPHPYYQFTRHCSIADINSSTYQQVFWCNMARTDASMGFSTHRPVLEPVSPRRHYPSDYMLRRFTDVNGSEIWLLVDSFVGDGYEGPEPYTSFFHAFNAALRVLKQQASAGDKALLKGFTGVVKARFPFPQDPADPHFLSDIGQLVQISNLKNRGTINASRNTVDPEVRPNILDYGFYWTYSNHSTASGTNPIIAINEAIDALRNECPTSAMRTIVLASDGIATCQALTPFPFDSTDPDDYACPSLSLATYNNAETQLTTGVLQRLVDNQISLVGIAAGAHIGPNFMNPGYDNPDTPEYDPRPLTPAEAFAHGVPWGQIFDISHTCPNDPGCSESTAFDRQASPGYVFRRPVQLLGQLAIQSGGVFCPLMPKCDSAHLPPSGVDCGASCYIEDPNNPAGPRILDPQHRFPENIPQTCSLFELNEAEQAAKCVVDFLGGSPYVLVTPQN